MTPNTKTARPRPAALLSLLLLLAPLSAASAAKQTVSSVAELMKMAAQSGHEITMKPGTYTVNDYLTEDRLSEIRAFAKKSTGKRPPMPVLTFAGSRNTFHLEGVTLVVNTRIYEDLPRTGYHRFFFVEGDHNTFKGLTIRYVGPNQGTNGNVLTLWGDHNTLENVTAYVHGSSPYGYGDLLGKGVPGMAPLQKQSGIMIGGDDCTLKRCKVISRAFGHCFYIQGGRNTLLQDCYAEGITRPTNAMLRETSGLAAKYDFKSVYENRDGRFLITPGYRKSLTEDGFRTYSSGGPREQKTGKTTIINCTAINTRAGFEIVGPANREETTTLTGCTALGTERGYLLINGNIRTRQCRGDVVHGPLLYLWRGSNADVELEVTGEGSDYLVHALATISGNNHRVKLTRWTSENTPPKIPILLGFGMPAHAEMSTPILPEKAENITLINETGMPLIIGSEAAKSTVRTDGVILENKGTAISIESGEE